MFGSRSGRSKISPVVLVGLVGEFGGQVLWAGLVVGPVGGFGGRVQ